MQQDLFTATDNWVLGIVQAVADRVDFYLHIDHLMITRGCVITSFAAFASLQIHTMSPLSDLTVLDMIVHYSGLLFWLVLVLLFFSCTNIVEKSHAAHRVNPYRRDVIHFCSRLMAILFIILSSIVLLRSFASDSLRFSGVLSYLQLLFYSGALFFLACEKAPPRVSRETRSA